MIPKSLADDPDLKRLFAEFDDMDLTMADFEWILKRMCRNMEIVLQARRPD